MFGRRSIRLTALVGALVVVGAACGGDTPESPSAATVTIKPASYTQRPAPTVANTGPVVIEPDDEGRTEQVQNYTVAPDEYPSNIADDFGVSLEDLMNINDWTLRDGIVPEFEGEGSEIRIPPGALVPAATTTTTAPVNPRPTTTTAAADDDPEPPSEPGTTTTLGDNCSVGSYTIVADDTTRVKVAERFDVTVEALDAANADTTGYGGFYPGLEIVIPPAADC